MPPPAALSAPAPRSAVRQALRPVESHRFSCHPLSTPQAPSAVSGSLSHGKLLPVQAGRRVPCFAWRCCRRRWLAMMSYPCSRRISRRRRLAVMRQARHLKTKRKTKRGRSDSLPSRVSVTIYPVRRGNTSCCVQVSVPLIPPAHGCPGKPLPVAVLLPWPLLSCASCTAILQDLRGPRRFVDAFCGYSAVVAAVLVPLCGYSCSCCCCPVLSALSVAIPPLLLFLLRFLRFLWLVLCWVAGAARATFLVVISAVVVVVAGNRQLGTAVVAVPGVITHGLLLGGGVKA